MDKISVIVPVYNAENYLVKCVESLLKQTYSNLEVVLIDDGSKDGSGKLCDEIAEKDSRVVVCHQDNAGVSVARNNGIKIASGQYIGFCDADDFVDVDMYETLYNSIKKNDSDIAMVSLSVHRLNGDIAKAFGSGKEMTVFKEEAIKHFLLDDMFCYSGYCHLIRSDICKSVHFQVGRKMHEDRYFTFEILTKIEKASIVDECKYHYVLHPESATMKPFGEERLDVVYFADKILGYIKVNYPNLQELAEINRMKACVDVYKLIIKEPGAEKKYKAIMKNMHREILNSKCFKGLPMVRKTEIYLLKYFEILYVLIIRVITYIKNRSL